MFKINLNILFERNIYKYSNLSKFRMLPGDPEGSPDVLFLARFLK